MVRISSGVSVVSGFARVAAAASLFFCITTCASAQASSRLPSPSTSLSPSGPSMGTITVYIRSDRGERLSVIPTLSLSSTSRGSIPGFAQGNNEQGWVFSDVQQGDEYEVEVKADGYQTASQTVMLVGGNSNVIVFLKPVDEELDFHPPGGQFVLAPRAQKEVEKGMKNLRDNKVPSAQKHFQKAIAMAPGSPYVNYLMGVSYLIAKQLPQARPYLEKSVSIDPKQPASLLALGTLRFQSADYAGAIQALNEDLQLDPSSWKAEWMLADSYLRQHDYEKARTHAEKALAVGKQKAMPVQLLLGQALAGVDDREGAVKALQTYLVAYPNDPNDAKIQSYIVRLQQPASTMETAATARATEGPSVGVSSARSEIASIPAPAPPVELPPKENWAPADIDAEKPFVISGAACPLSKVLDQAGRNTVQLVTDLQEFSATEEYESVEVKRDERLETPITRTFSYLVYIETPRPRLIEVKEIRNNNLVPADMPGRLADNGAPGLVLAFHPVYRDDFFWQCEGLGEWKDQPAWLVHFEQRSDRPTSLLAAFDTPSEEFALPLKGRAWISTKTGQVVRLEADLARPVEPLDLKRQHFVIEYAPVTFSAHKVTLWLPESVDVYIQYQGHYLHHQHRFSNFQLFWVGTSQEIEAPKQGATLKQKE
jgi:tetratricopeptide (TPR) repeat protein